MAPTAQASNSRGSYNGEYPHFESRSDFLKAYGKVEYHEYRENTKNPLSYQDWKASDHVFGAYLWNAALEIWDGCDSTDLDTDSDASSSNVRAPAAQLEKSSTTNGHGMRTTVIPSASTKLKTSAGTTTRKKKSKKKFLSEEIVPSDASDDIAESSAGLKESPMAEQFLGTGINEQRRSGGRKKKQFLSEETISPEDLENDSLTIEDGNMAASSSHEFGPPAEQVTPVATTSPKSFKIKSGKKSQKKHLSHAPISQDDDDDGSALADDVMTPKNATASPEDPGSSSSSRRGLRIRTPAQQRPYYHHARVFEDLVSEPEPDTNIRPSPRAKTTKLAQVLYPDDLTDIQYEREGTPDLENNEHIGEPLTNTSTGPLELPPPRKAHYKGKGRAWKKTSEDEDEDYVSPIKNRLSNQPKRQVGRRKSVPTSYLQGEKEDDFELEEMSKDVSEQSPQEKIALPIRSPVQAQKVGNPKRKPRKTHSLSEEFVRDDSDTTPEGAPQLHAQTQPERVPEPAVAATPKQKTPKKRGRPRKNNQKQKHPPKNTSAVAEPQELRIEVETMSKSILPATQPNNLPETSAETVAEYVTQEGPTSPVRNPRKRKSEDPDAGNGESL